MLWFQLTLSHAFTNVTKLSVNNWAKEIEKRGDNVWMVMFHGDRCPACQQVYPIFQEAATKADGCIKFGNIDTSQDYQISNKFDIRSIPTFIVFHPNGEEHYESYRSAKAMLTFCEQYLLDRSETPDETWAPGYGQRFAILFSKKTPAPWMALSSEFLGKVKIGQTNNETLKKLFNVTKTPTVVVVNEEAATLHKYGKYSELRDLIQPLIKAPVTVRIESLSDIEKDCKASRKFCVITGGSMPSHDYVELAKRYKHDPFKFMMCGEECDDKYKEGIWIIHPRRNAYMILNSLDSIDSTLDNIAGGIGKWINMPKDSDL